MQVCTSIGKINLLRKKSLKLNSDTILPLSNSRKVGRSKARADEDTGGWKLLSLTTTKAGAPPPLKDGGYNV